MYRRRTKGSHLHQRMAAMRAAKERKRMEGAAPDYPVELPEVRRRIIVEDYDFGCTRHELLLLRSGRIDCYRVLVDGREVGTMGWSRAVEMTRKAFVRVRQVN